MGQSSSTDQLSPEQREAESIAASTGALPKLQKAFSVLSDPQTNSIPIESLKKCFSFTIENSGNEGNGVPKDFPVLLSYLSSCIVDLFFFSDGEVGWIEFLKGYSNCCGMTIGSASFNNLFRLFAMMSSEAGLHTKLQFVSNDDDNKVSGYLLSVELLMLLLMCWVMWWDCKKLNSGESLVGDSGLPDVTHLVWSAIESCAEEGGKLDLWECKALETYVQLPAAKITMWALKTVPNLTDCLSHFVHARLSYLANLEDKSTQPVPFVFDISPKENSISNLITCGRAWAISLTLRGTMSDEISKACFPSSVDDLSDMILYRSSVHGKGLTRFWSNVEGYNAPLLILIAAYEPKDGAERKWIIGALINQGLESKDSFYGTSGSLYAISPVFNVFSSSGKEKNIVYSHLHPTFKMYDPRPKPVGLAFGGSLGHERIFLEEDFAGVTIRHHAADRTYQHGSLFPGQGFLTHEASVLDVEVWGLGGKKAKETQTAYKRREELFTEQRRKVDLKTFGNWEDSPEKMMMDMITDPNAVRREDR
ncbi:PREDICTED: uncharacterized protein LOC109149534 [Ipomoea nil]|uniref:uncharacterized protein LOC109149534 n=1 Tax=Ipomoea nil TaxID=35883 RepID=UPI000901AE90|nr:PREDICTED: uncharacterized protein LOC109149534 [Ipomoea nil]